MALQLIFAFLGFVIGIALLSDGGWLFGALMGFLLAKVMQMSHTIQEQSKKIELLESMQAYLQSTLRSLMPPTSEPSAAQTSTNVSTAEAKTKTPEEKLPDVDADIDSVAEPKQIPAQQPASEIFDLPIPDDLVEPAKPVVIKKPVDMSEDKITRWVKDFFFKGNPVVRIGMLVLFFGLSFLVKYAATQGYFPIELRLTAVALIAITLIVIGWKTRERAGGFGLVLQGGGLAALYLTCFATAKMYELIPLSLSLGLLLVFVAFGVLLAVVQNAQVLAIMAIAGGFIAPIITSSGSNNFVGLFSIYLILNLGVLALSWFKTWRLLNWIGFVFTFVITAFWGVLRYEPQFYSSTQPFLIIFFLMYLSISILFSLKQPPSLKGLVDGSLVFGLPIAAFGLQIALLKHTEYGVAISALVLAFLYMGLARWLWTRFSTTHKLLSESFLALGVGFATLAIPLGVNADLTAAAWALEAVGLLWVGLRQSRDLPRIAAVLLYLGASVAFLLNPLRAGSIPLLQGDFLGMFLLSASALVMAYLFFVYEKSVHELEHAFGKCLAFFGMAWWIAAIILELDAHLADELSFAVFYLLIAGSLFIQYRLAARFEWASLASLNHLYFWVILLWTLLGIIGKATAYPTDLYLAVPFMVFAAAQYQFLAKMESRDWRHLLQTAHLMTGLWVLGLILWQAKAWPEHSNLFNNLTIDDKQLFIHFILIAGALCGLCWMNLKNYWPLSSWTSIYRDWITLPYVILLFAWFIYALHHSGVINNFYLPLLSPVDLAQFAAIILLGYLMKGNLSFTQSWSHGFKKVVLAGLVFIWINLLLLRSLHYFLLIPYELSALWKAPVVQMSISILWALCALVCMNQARRLVSRHLWLAGAGLLGLVLVKLFTVDLSGRGTLARVVSFMVVGILILVIGYLSPIPPRQTEAEKS